MAHNLVLEAEHLTQVFTLLQPQDLPNTELNAQTGSWINTRSFMLSLLKRCICPTAVSDELLVKLQAVGFKRTPWTVESLTHQIKANKDFQRAIINFVYLWVIKFVLPLMDKDMQSFSSTDSDSEYRLDLNVSTREMDRCAITGIYSVEAFGFNNRAPGKVVPMRILPECLRSDDKAQHLVQVFTGGRIHSIRSIIDKPENAIFMSEAITDSFREFYWSLKPAATTAPRTTRSNLAVERLAALQVPEIASLPPNSPVVLGDNEASLSVPPPSPDLCRLHLAVGQILNETGSLPMILRFSMPGTLKEAKQ
ncbi:hypothetical protein DIZ76_012832 [Coccidioides immitis]|nr:hypothetical protein DIZ76_012832 [Coccidioides immitis]